MVAAAGGGFVALIVSLIQTSMGAGARQMAQLLRQIPPEVIQQLRKTRLHSSSVCCLGGKLTCFYETSSFYQAEQRLLSPPPDSPPG